MHHSTSSFRAPPATAHLRAEHAAARALRCSHARIMQLFLGLLFAATATSAYANWHYGTVNELGIGYDGSTVTVKVTGLQRNDCTCYVAWPDQACLDRTRASFLEEYTPLLSARRAGQSVGINIDETTCKIQAIYEVDY